MQREAPAQPDVVFRVYQPEFEDLRPLMAPIETEPRAAISQIESIISDAKRNAPDLESSVISLAPRKNDIDLKRMMQPMIDNLLEETREALSKMRVSK